jgi:hypothetical protein
VQLEDIQNAPTNQSVVQWERWFEDLQYRKINAAFAR